MKMGGLLMVETKKFAFIAHYVESWNWLLNFKIFGFLHKRPELHYILFPLFPLCWLMSLIALLRKQPFKMVDNYLVSEGLIGYTILINNFAWHFLFKSRYNQIRARILAATLFAQNKLGVDVVGLGALTKAESVTNGGSWLKDQKGVTIPIVHGDTCTAWFVIKRLEELYEEVGRDKPMVLIGPTSKIGRAVMLYLGARGYVIKAYTDALDRFLEIQKELPLDCRGNLIRINSLEQAKDCPIWVTGKFKPDGHVLTKFVPKGAIVLNFAVPDPLKEHWLNDRKDIRHFDGGLVQTPDTCSMRFTMRLTSHITYACTAGTIAHAKYGWKESEVGSVCMDELERVGVACEQMGFKLAPRTSHLKKVF